MEGSSRYKNSLPWLKQSEMLETRLLKLRSVVSSEGRRKKFINIRIF